MKREFLQNIKVGDTALPSEVIDAIMAENGRDVEAAKKPYADYDAIKDQLKTAQDGLKAFAGVDVSQLNGEITKLRGQLADKDKAWQAKLDGMAFDGPLQRVGARKPLPRCWTWMRFEPARTKLRTSPQPWKRSKKTMPICLRATRPRRMRPVRARSGRWANTHRKRPPSARPPG